MTGRSHQWKASRHHNIYSHSSGKPSSSIGGGSGSRRVKVSYYANQVAAAVRQAATAATSGSFPPLLKAGLMIEADAKKSMKKGGRAGYKPRSRSRGIPSTPPNPPHVQTGNLRNNISTGLDSKTLSVVVGITKAAWYGITHEHDDPKQFGPYRFPPRPFMKPALIRCMPKIVEYFRNLGLAATPAGKWLNSQSTGIVK